MNKEFRTVTLTGAGEGVIERVAAAIKNLSADSPPLLHRLASKLFGKVPTPKPAPDASQAIERPENEAPAPAPAAAPAVQTPDPLAGWSATEREELRQMESYLTSLQTEDERDEFTARLLASIRAHTAAPKQMKHDAFRALPFGEANAFMRGGGKLVP